MIDATGGTSNVTGKSIAMAAIGPIPGRTPMTVPMNTPTKQYQRFVKETAVAVPEREV